MNNSVAIVGAGLAGQLAALALAQCELDVSLIDQKPLAHLDPSRGSDKNLPDDQRTTALSERSVEFLTQQGLWAPLSQAASPVYAMNLGAGDTIDQSLRHQLRLDRRDADRQQLAWIVENKHLASAFQHGIRQQMSLGRIKLFDAVDIDKIAIKQDRVIIEFNDKDSLEMDLLLGCDGRHSKVRKLCFDDIRTATDYQRRALIAVISHAQNHHQVATQLFLSDGPLALLPMTTTADGVVRSSMIWSAMPDWVRAMEKLDHPTLIDNLSQRFQAITGEVHGVAGVASYPLYASISAQFTGHAVALVGDAAHAVHPLAGQGFNLAVGDVAALAECLLNAQHLGQAIGSRFALEAYSQARKIEAQKIFMLTDGLHRLFSHRHLRLPGVKSWAFPAINPVRPLKRRLIQAALS